MSTVLCYIVGPCCLPTLYIIVVRLLISYSQFVPAPFTFGNRKFAFYVCKSVSVL